MGCVSYFNIQIIDILINDKNRLLSLNSLSDALSNDNSSPIVQIAN